MMAIARAPSLEGRLRSVVISRAMLRAEGVFCGPAGRDRRGVGVSAAAGCPFRDHAQAAEEPGRFHAAPEFTAVATTLFPFGLELLRERIERAHAAAEHVGPPATNDLADDAARLAGASDDLLDRNTSLSQREHGGVFRPHVGPSRHIGVFRPR